MCSKCFAPPILHGACGASFGLVCADRPPTWTGRAPELCGRALRPGLVLLLRSVVLLFSCFFSWPNDWRCRCRQRGLIRQWARNLATEFRGAAKTRTRGGRRRTRPGHRAKPQSSGARPRRGQQEDKTRTQSRATEPSHKVQGRGQDGDNRRKRAGHRAKPQSPATEFLGAAKPRTRGGQDPDTKMGHRDQPQRSWARPVSVASSLFPRIDPQQQTVWGITEVKPSQEKSSYGSRREDKTCSDGKNTSLA